MLLTKKEIFERLKQDGVDLGENPFRTFLYYQETGLIPEPEGKRKNAYLFPETTIDAIKLIKKLQQEGESISDIKKIYKNAMKSMEFESRETREKKEVVNMVYEAFKDEVDGIENLKNMYQQNNNITKLHGDDAEMIYVTLLEKYGDFVKDLAIRKFCNTCKLLDDIDIKINLVKKISA